ncbi:hypothetical protein FQN57_000158 [Myotisia sp. PD_48]|nr:hypothetical protein FQN57_000158 [Myotisia sp. PD_48]
MSSIENGTCPHIDEWFKVFYLSDPNAGECSICLKEEEEAQARTVRDGFDLVHAPPLTKATQEGLLEFIETTLFPSDKADEAAEELRNRVGIANANRYANRNVSAVRDDLNSLAIEDIIHPTCIGDNCGIDSTPESNHPPIPELSEWDDSRVVNDPHYDGYGNNSGDENRNEHCEEPAEIPKSEDSPMFFEYRTPSPLDSLFDEPRNLPHTTPPTSESLSAQRFIPNELSPTPGAREFDSYMAAAFDTLDEPFVWNTQTSLRQIIENNNETESLSSSSDSPIPPPNFSRDDYPAFRSAPEGISLQPDYVSNPAPAPALAPESPPPIAQHLPFYAKAEDEDGSSNHSSEEDDEEDLMADRATNTRSRSQLMANRGI